MSEFQLVGDLPARAPTVPRTERARVLAALENNNSILRELGLIYGAAGPVKVPAQTIRHPSDAAEFCASMMHLPAEQFRVLVLSTKQGIVDVVTLYAGTVNAASIRVAEVLRPVIVANAPAFVAVHNHPSGDPAPSPADLIVTRRIVAAAETMDIDFQDHVIVAGGRFQSLRQYGSAGW